MPSEEIDTDYYENLVKNRLWIAPEDLISAVGLGVVVKQSDQYGFTTTAGGIILAESGTFEKKYNLCEVIAVGEMVPKSQCDVGDIAIIQRSTAFRMPDGINAPSVWRVIYDTMHIIAVLPNLEAARLSEKFREGGALHHATKRDSYITFSERYAKNETSSPLSRKTRP